jgi:hydrogenase maturation protease
VSAGGFWEELERPAPQRVVVDGVELGPSSYVRLRPRAGGDIMDLALAGRTAVVEGIDQDTDGNVQLAVVVTDDPGRDLGERRQPGHRFFFAPEEVEPLRDGDAGAAAAVPTRILVAGIGNTFLGDDGFGPALAGRLARRTLPAGVEVVDFGIRGLDLAYAMQDPALETVVLLDAAPRGQPPGTLSVVEPEEAAGGEPVEVDAHAMNPLAVLALARELAGPAGRLPRTLLVCCEPETRMSGDEDEIVAVLSDPVAAALGAATALTEELLEDLTTTQPPTEGSTR